MVVPIPNTPNTNKPKENVTVNYSTNLTTHTTQNPLVSPNFQTNKVLTPIQQIKVIGKGADPNVIINNLTNTNPYVRENRYPTNTSNIITKPSIINESKPQSIEISPEKVFGSLYNGQSEQEALKFLQITNGLTLPEISKILSQYSININNWTNANIAISGNKIILNYTYSSPLESVIGDQVVGNITNNYTLEIENINGWVFVKYKNYQTSTYMGHPSSPSINETYYVINPITKKITYTGPNISEAVIWKQPLMSPTNAINSALSQYGYTLSYGAIEQINNLQPGQSITVYAIPNTTVGENPYGALIKITNLGNGQYNIQSTTPINNKGKWISINENVNIPTATENILTGSISTTNYNITGKLSLESSGSLNSTNLATYSISESYPITYTIKNNQITFQFGNPSVNNVSLQSINVPTLTNQQLQALESGQNLNLPPGWYYNPSTGEFIQLSYQTVQQPQINWNNLWFGYSSMYQNNPYWFGYSSIQPTNTKTTTSTTNQPKILQNSFFTPQLIGDIWNSITTLGSDVYNWFTSLFSSQKPKSSNITTSNSPNSNSQIQQSQSPVIYTYPSYISGVMTKPVKLSKQQIEQNELQNIIFKSQMIEQEVNPKYNQAYGGPTWLGIDVYANLAQMFAGLGLKQPAQFFLNLAEQAKSFGTPANVLANVAGLGEILGSIAMVEYSVPEELSGSIGINALNAIKTQLTPINFAKNYALTTIPNLIISNAVNYRLTGQPLSLQQNLQIAAESIPFTFVYSGIGGYYESISNDILGNIISPETSTKLAIASKVLYDTGANFAAGVGSNLAMQGFNNLMGWQNGINLNEALFSGIFSAGVTLGFEGIQGIRAITSGGSKGIWSIASGSPYRYKTSNVDVTFPYREENLLKAKVDITGETTYFPRIGKLTLTSDVLPNVKAKVTPFETEGELNLVKGGSIQNEYGWILTGYGYNGEFITRSGNSVVTANVQGNIPLIIIPKEYPIELYTQNISNLLNRLESEHPEFKEISYVPWKGLAGFKSLLEGNTYNLFNNYNAYLYNRLLEGPLTISNEFGFTPNEYLNALQYAEQAYNEISANLPNNVKPLNLPNQESLNIKVPFSYFKTENANFNEGNFGRVVIGNTGIAKTSSGETYIIQSESFGPIYFTGGENSQLSSLLTTYGIMKNPKTDINWVYLHQSGSVSLPGNVQLSWGIGEAIDPTKVQELLESFNEIGNGQPIQNLPLTQEQLQALLKEAIKSNAEQFTYPPTLYRSINVYGFPIVNTNYNINQKVINQRSNYNIGMSRIPNVVQNINHVAQQLSYNIEKPLLNEFNIQNELNAIRENLIERIRLPNQIQPTININPLQNYGKERIQPIIQNIQIQRNQITSFARPLSLGKELLRPRQRLRSLGKEEERGELLLPKMEIVAGEIYRQETTKPITTITTTLTKTKPTTSTFPSYPPVGFPPFIWPNITIMGQPIRGLVPGFGRGVRSMYDIQYALSRLQW